MRKYRRHMCEHCDYMITYEPKPGWNGDLRCPLCSKMTHVYQMDDFLTLEVKLS